MPVIKKGGYLVGDHQLPLMLHWGARHYIKKLAIMRGGVIRHLRCVNA
jgi:hypothetical protein